MLEAWRLLIRTSNCGDQACRSRLAGDEARRICGTLEAVSLASQLLQKCGQVECRVETDALMGPV